MENLNLNYDIVIVGGATSGAYFGKLLAEQGKKVLIVEKSSKDKVGTKYDIFHIPKKDFEKFEVPLPPKNDPAWAFEFDKIDSISSKNKYPKRTKMEVVGLHMHDYVLKLLNWACSYGVEVMFETEFCELLYHNSKVVGLILKQDNKMIQINSKLVSDCSGISSIVRRKLKSDSTIENFEITGDDMFYVILRYVEYVNEQDYIKANRSWLYYKTWEAPQPNPKGAILGIGANFSFEYANEVWREFEKKISLPEYKLEHIEKGKTPFRRPPYSFVDDGVIVMGDAACLTKPFNGEGVVSSWVQTQIAFKVINELLDKNLPLTKENLWKINKEYINVQGAKFASSLATVVGAIATNEKENNFFYKHDIIFSQKSFEHMNEYSEMYFSKIDILVMALKMFWGLITFRLRISTIKKLLKAMENGNKIKTQYLLYPDNPNDYFIWKEQTDKMWKEIGSISDAVR